VVFDTHTHRESFLKNLAADNTLERKGRGFFYFSTKFLKGKQKKW